LAGTGSGTAQAVDAAKAVVAVSQAAVAGDQAAIDTAKLNLDFATVAAPVGGRVGLRQVNVGAIIRATDATGIVTITQMLPISVQFSLPQDELPAILAGQGQTRRWCRRPLSRTARIDSLCSLLSRTAL
jgi:multidrug efflux system membrane fusion protein